MLWMLSDNGYKIFLWYGNIYLQVCHIVYSWCEWSGCCIFCLAMLSVILVSIYNPSDLLGFVCPFSDTDQCKWQRVRVRSNTFGNEVGLGLFSNNWGDSTSI